MGITRWISPVCVARLLLITLIWLVTSSLNIVSSMTLTDQMPSATEFGEKYFLNLTSSTIKNKNLTHVTQIHIIPEWPAMLIGANNTLYVFNLNHGLDISTAKSLEWVPNIKAKTMCRLKGKGEDDCQNYIKVIAPDNINGRLLICGTYAQSPSCISLEANMSNLESQWEITSESNVIDGVFKCPFNKDQKNTAIFADGSLYAGTVADFTAREAVLTRSLSNNDMYPDLRTKQSDSIWLNLPEFIKSYQEDNEVYFFFREISIETQHTGKMYYSRIARVCKNDNGADLTWTTFLKARLNCSFHGEFPFHFNYLQDVVRVVEEDKVFYYGIFTTGDHEIPGSAICKFNLDQIRENFRTGLFKQTTAPWEPVPAADVPDNRPGSCSSEPTQLSNEELNFIKTHPLMFSPAKNYKQDDPLFTITRSNYRLQKLVTTKKGRYTIVFAGTDDGHVMKLVLRERQDEVSPLLLYNMHVIEGNHPITNMRLYKKSNNQEVIYLTSNDAVIEMPVQHCQYLKNCSCKQDPYCEWIENSGKCIVNKNENYNGVELDCTDPIADVDSSLGDCTSQGTDDEDHIKSETSTQSSLDDPTTTLIVLAIVGWAICFIEMAVVVCWCLMRKNKGKYEVTSLTEPDQSRQYSISRCLLLPINHKLTCLIQHATTANKAQIFTSQQSPVNDDFDENISRRTQLLIQKSF